MLIRESAEQMPVLTQTVLLSVLSSQNVRWKDAKEGGLLTGEWGEEDGD